MKAHRHILIVQVNSGEAEIFSTLQPENQQRFAEITTGHDAIMATFESTNLSIKVTFKNGSVIILKPATQKPV